MPMGKSMRDMTHQMNQISSNLFRKASNISVSDNYLDKYTFVVISVKYVKNRLQFVLFFNLPFECFIFV